MLEDFVSIDLKNLTKTEAEDLNSRGQEKDVGEEIKEKAYTRRYRFHSKSTPQMMELNIRRNDSCRCLECFERSYNKEFENSPQTIPFDERQFYGLPYPVPFISYKDDECSISDEKPPLSYVALISMAIRSSPTGKMTLAEIYRYLTDNFKYFKERPNRGWMNAIRHNLTLNDCFVKLPRDPLMRGKGGYWCIDPESKGMFNHGSLRRRRVRYKRNRKDDEVLKNILSPSDCVQPLQKKTDTTAYSSFCVPGLIDCRESPEKMTCYTGHCHPTPIYYMKPKHKIKRYSDFSVETILSKIESNH